MGRGARLPRAGGTSSPRYVSFNSASVARGAGRGEPAGTGRGGGGEWKRRAAPVRPPAAAAPALLGLASPVRRGPPPVPARPGPPAPAVRGSPNRRRRARSPPSREGARGVWAGPRVGPRVRRGSRVRPWARAAAAAAGPAPGRAVPRLG